VDAVDLALLSAGPTLTGSVQRMYAIHERGKEYLLCEACDDGSVFDVGRFFIIEGSGQARNTLRHQVFAAIGDPARWTNLMVEPGRFSDENYFNRLLRSETMGELKLRGAPSHHIGAVDPITGRVDHSSTARPSPLVLIERMPVVRPLRTHLHCDSVYDYSAYAKATVKVIALEQIVRLGLPGGSAVLNRFREFGGAGFPKADMHISRYGAALPLRSWSRLARPVCDWQCKYEDHDRNLDPQEALYISGISARQLSTVGDLLVLCSLMVGSILARGGLTLWDLKWEVAASGDQFIVVDTMDHDSMRVTHQVQYQGDRCSIHFNKQAIRDYYKIFHPDWINAVRDAKQASVRGAENRPFMQLYTEGVDRGTYPAIPALDAEYADLQARKYQYVTDVARGSADQGVGLDLAQRELSYYEQRGRLAELIEYVVPMPVQ
jgi:phosphoribosylaminoimidazole-succinocarboxamide synthase